MKDPTRPSFWRLHLLTAVVLMFAAGAFMWINFSREECLDCWEDRDDEEIVTFEIGWPSALGTLQKKSSDQSVVHFTPCYSGLAINALCGAVALALVAFVVESILRGYDGRRP